MSIIISEKEYLNFGNCVSISNGTVEAMITIDLGPHIIYYGFVGGTNVMRTDVERRIVTQDERIKQHYGTTDKWLIYGGHRLWVSPEKMPNTYFIEDKPVEYKKVDNGALFIQTPQTMNGVHNKMEITMNEKGELKIVHFVKNISDNTKTCSPWAISVLAQGGLEIIPNNTLNTELLPNRKIIAWSYTNLADERVYFGEKYITLQQNPKMEQPFKLGLDNQAGIAMYVLDDVVFVNSYEHKSDGVYDDFGVSFETYTANEFLEMETIGTISNLKPGETAEHVENWSVFKNIGTPSSKDGASLDAFYKNYIK